jgi:hypothetical protein
MVESLSPAGSSNHFPIQQFNKFQFNEILMQILNMELQKHGFAGANILVNFRLNELQPHPGGRVPPEAFAPERRMPARRDDVVFPTQPGRCSALHGL